ncbi:MAG: type II secretion system F family protein [Armatimonadota bacterium]
MTEHTQTGRLIALTPFARRMSYMIGTGITLMRSLAAAEESEASPELAEAIREVRERIGRGETISQAMAARPDWFDRLALSMVRAGEVSGILDETLRAWAETLEWALELRQRVVLTRTVAGLLRGDGGAAPRPDTPMTAIAHPVLRAALFCYALGVMLQSGVPVLQALDVAAQGLDDADAQAVRAARQALRDGPRDEPSRLADDLAAVTGLDATAVSLLRVGEQTGRLDEAALQVSDLLRWQVEHEVLAELLAAGDGA